MFRLISKLLLFIVVVTSSQWSYADGWVNNVGVKDVYFQPLDETRNISRVSFVTNNDVVYHYLYTKEDAVERDIAKMYLSVLMTALSTGKTVNIYYKNYTLPVTSEVWPVITMVILHNQ